MVDLIIKSFGLDDYFFSVTSKNEYNTSGKTELHTLNSEGAVAIGVFSCLRTIIEYKVGI